MNKPQSNTCQQLLIHVSLPFGESHVAIEHAAAVDQHSAFVHHLCLWQAGSALLADDSLEHATASSQTQTL